MRKRNPFISFLLITLAFLFSFFVCSSLALLMEQKIASDYKGLGLSEAVHSSCVDSRSLITNIGLPGTTSLNDVGLDGIHSYCKKPYRHYNMPGGSIEVVIVTKGHIPFPGYRLYIEMLYDSDGKQILLKITRGVLTI